MLNVSSRAPGLRVSSPDVVVLLMGNGAVVGPISHRLL